MSVRRSTIGATASAVLVVTLFVGCDNPRIAAVWPASLSPATPSNTADVDAVVQQRLLAALRDDPITHASEIQLTISHGHVRLSGFVQSAAEKLRASILVSEADGVVALDNRLILRRHAGIGHHPLGNARVHL